MRLSNVIVVKHVYFFCDVLPQSCDCIGIDGDCYNCVFDFDHRFVNIMDRVYKKVKKNGDNK